MEIEVGIIMIGIINRRYHFCHLFQRLQLLYFSLYDVLAFVGELKSNNTAK